MHTTKRVLGSLLVASVGGFGAILSGCSVAPGIDVDDQSSTSGSDGGMGGNPTTKTAGGDDTGGYGGQGGIGGDDTPVDPLDACSDALEQSPNWFASEYGLLAGSMEFGQTHVIGAVENRHAPPLIEGREAIVLFTPSAPLANDNDVRIAAFDGDQLLGVLQAAPPARCPYRSSNDSLTYHWKPTAPPHGASFCRGRG